MAAKQALKPRPSPPSRRREALAAMERGLAAENALEHRKAVAAFRRALEIDPDLHRARFGLARVRAASGRTRRAIRLLRRFLEARPRDHAALALLGRCLLAENRPQEAADAYERAVSLRPDASEPVLRFAGAVALAGDQGRACAILREALLRMPNDQRLRSRLAWLLLDAGENREACALVEPARHVQLPDAQLWASSEIFATAGDAARADALIDRLDPNGPFGDRQRLSRTLRGRLSALEALRAHLDADGGADVFAGLLLVRAMRRGSPGERMAALRLMLRDAASRKPILAGWPQRRAAIRALYRSLPPYGDRAARDRRLVSLVSPIHRNEDVGSLVRALRGIDHPRKEAIIVVNARGIDPVALERRLAGGGFERVLVLYRPELDGVARALNEGLDEARGDVLARIDADDFYAPGYVSRSLAWMDRAGAEICGRSDYFCHFEELGATVLVVRETVAPDLAAPIVATGSTMIFTREVAEAIRFDPAKRLGEDIRFYNDARSHGFRYASAPPFDHMVVRKSDKGRHSWRSSDLMLFDRRSILVGAGSRPGRCV